MTCNVEPEDIPHTDYAGRRRRETAAVKHALIEASLPVTSVKHGTGTGSHWLKIKLDTHWTHEQSRQVIEIVQRVTGRHGAYDGDINVHFVLV